MSAMFPSAGPLWRLDLGKDGEADEADQDDRHAIAMQHLDPWLAERHDAEHHQPLGDGLEVARAELLEGHGQALVRKPSPEGRRWLRGSRMRRCGAVGI